MGAKKRRKGREDGVDSHRFQPEISLGEINPSHLWKREFKKENNRKVGGKHDFTEDKRLLSDDVTHGPAFSTHAQNLTVIPGQGLFHVVSALSRAESADDASFIAAESTLEQGGSSLASHGEHQLRCETLPFKHDLLCAAAA